MNDLEDFVCAYEKFFKIENCDSWSLNDLLQYTLELILSGDEDCIPAEVLKDFDLNRKHMLDEIDNSIISEQKKRTKIPPMPIVAENISHLGAYLKEDELSKLGDLLNGEYRGNKGIKNNTQMERQVAIDRTQIFENFITKMKYEDAISKLAERERIDNRTAQRSIKKGREFFKEDISNLFKKLNPDMTAFVLRRARLKTIKDEIKMLMSFPVEASRRKCKSDENLIKALRESCGDHLRGT